MKNIPHLTLTVKQPTAISLTSRAVRGDSFSKRESLAFLRLFISTLVTHQSHQRVREGRAGEGRGRKEGGGNYAAVVMNRVDMS